MYLKFSIEGAAYYFLYFQIVHLCANERNGAELAGSLQDDRGGSFIARSPIGDDCVSKTVMAH